MSFNKTNKPQIYSVSIINHYRVVATSPTNAVQKILDGSGIPNGWSVDVKNEEEDLKKK